VHRTRKHAVGTTGAVIIHLALKEDKLVKANLIEKLKEKLNLIILLLFNRYILSLNKDSITLR
jgi:hypothetical protein